MNNKTNGSFSKLKKALLIVHQKRSDPGVIGQKLIDREYQLDIRRPVLGEKLPNSMEETPTKIPKSTGSRLRTAQQHAEPPPKASQSRSKF